jgi:protein-tyrosine-phosphatase
MKKAFSILVLMIACSLAFSQTKKVIFVCEHGAAKSFIAATYFNQLAKESNLNWEAVCRATLPDSSLNVGTRNGLKADHLYEPNRVPVKIAYQDTIQAEKIILFTKLPPDWQSEIETQDWSTLPNIDSNYQQRRDAIIKKLKELISALE